MKKTNNTSSYEAALWYANHYKFAVFPTHGIKQIYASGKFLNACTCGDIACANPGKHPAVMKGRNAASKDESVLLNLWASRDGLNLAIATGIESGIFVIDIDGQKGSQSLDALEEKHGKLPVTLTCSTGRGRHLYFKYPDKKVFNRTNNLGNNIDVRGDGGYVIAPPSNHISGSQYQWWDEKIGVAEAPVWLLDLVCATGIKAPRLNEAALNFSVHDSNWTKDDVYSMLDFINPDIGYSDWINIGMALHNGGFPIEMWDEWSRRGTKYDGNLAFHWKSFRGQGGITIGTLIDAAKIQGWKPSSYIVEKVDYETHPAKDWLIEIGAYTPISVPEKVVYFQPEIDPLKLPTLIGDTVRWIYDTSLKPQANLAMLNTLACLGAVFGRRYASPWDTRTNLYIVGIAATGIGKDSSRKRLRNIMRESDLKEFLGPDDIKSGSGLLTTLQSQPSCVMMIDEFGIILQSIVGDKAAAHKAEIGGLFLKLYSSSGDEYRAGNYADKKNESQEAIDPNLCIYGTSTLDNYIMALKRIAVSGGDLNRFLVLPGDNNPPLRDEDIDAKVPDYILDAWKALIPPPNGLTSLNNALIRPTMKTVEWGNAFDYIKTLGHIENDLRKEGDKKGVGALWCRYRENVIKIAMLFAICRNPQNPKINMGHEYGDIEIAEKIVYNAVMYVVNLCLNHMYENDVERNKKEVANIIKTSGFEGISRVMLMRRCQRLRIKEINEVIAGLIEEEKILAIATLAGDKKSVVYYWDE